MAGDCIRLTAVKRVKIELGLRDGLSLTAIAAELGRPKGTMSKEIARNGGRDTYDAGAAHIRMENAPRGGRRNRLSPGEPLFEAVACLLRKRWSPEQIAGRRKRMEGGVEASSGLLFCEFWLGANDGAVGGAGGSHGVDVRNTPIAESAGALRRALSPTFPAGEMVFFIPWRVVAEDSGAAQLDLLGPPGWCSGCWPHEGDVAGGAVDFHLVIFRFGAADGARAIGANDAAAAVELRGRRRRPP